MNRSDARLLSLFGLTLIAGCGGDPAVSPPDAQIDGSISTRDSSADSSAEATVDSSVPRVAAPFCGACRVDDDCGPGAACLTLGEGERSCGRPCTNDESCTQYGANLVCAANGDAPRQCRPRAQTCAGSSVLAACSTASPCRGRFYACADVGLFGASACTLRCDSDADCVERARRCRPVPSAGGAKHCVADLESAPERCDALATAGRATRCGAGDTCAAGSSCFGRGTTKLCLAPPSPTCPTGTIERASSRGAVCVPTSGDFDGWISATTPDCDCVLDGATDTSAAATPLDRSLGALSRARCQMSFASADLNILDEFVPHVARDRFRLSLTDTVHGYWPNTGAFGKRLAADIDRATIDDPHDPTGLLRVVESLELAHYADFRIAPKSLPPQGSLASALLEFAELAREISGTGEVDSEAIATQAASVDEALARRFADVVRAVTTATRVRERAISRVRAQRDELFETPQGLYLDAFRRPDATTPEFHNTLLGDVDVSAMVSAARDVVATIRETQLALGAGVAPVAATLTLDTGLGRVALRGNGADVYDPADWERTILLVDTGGDDIYRFGAGSNATAAQPIGVVVDLGGSDRYGYREVPIAADASPGNTRLPSDAAGRYTPRTNDSAGPYSMSKVSRQGAGRLGIGILLDLGTERDEYRSHRVSQGYGALGVGVLYDREGDDLYIAEAASQGAAVAGVGLLIDSFGNDSYTAYHASQGFGYTRGIGALFDHRGDDTYVAVATDFLYANAQDPRASNTSMSQGAGYGRRRDQLDTGDLESMSGGIGILRDSRGNDRYTAQIFAQGVGYWWGIGALLDGDGNDHYDGQWYVQGSAAHFATAIFIDDGGDDVHNMTARRMNAALGTGHDFSIGWFQSRGGADHYLAPNLSLGSGNAAGVGIFIDESGVDRYESTSDLSFGNADIETPATDTLQFQAGTHGLFFDLGGVDTYARPIGVPVGDNMSWRQQRHTGVNELGAGRDEEGRW